MCKYIEMGAKPKIAAMGLGIPSDRFERWYSRGKQAAEGKPSSRPVKAIYLEFYNAIQAAHAKHLGHILALAHQAMKITPELAFKFLTMPHFQRMLGSQEDDTEARPAAGVTVQIVYPNEAKPVDSSDPTEQAPGSDT